MNAQALSRSNLVRSACNVGYTLACTESYPSQIGQITEIKVTMDSGEYICWLCLSTQYDLSKQARMHTSYIHEFMGS